MRRINTLIGMVALCVFTMVSTSWAIDAQLSSERVKAGDAITVTGSINPGQELFVVVATETNVQGFRRHRCKREKGAPGW